MGNDAFALVVVVTDIYFNPRSRVGNDTECPFSEFWEDISIHVPAWGTTLPSPLYVTYLKFQSTFPRGERLGARKFGTYILDFNPRSRVGNDIRRQSKEVSLVISIHVPAWGTTYRGNKIITSQTFQSTFPRGERRSCQQWN